MVDTHAVLQAPDESAVLGKRLGTPSDMQSTGEMRIVMPEDEAISP